MSRSDTSQGPFAINAWRVYEAGYTPLPIAHPGGSAVLGGIDSLRGQTPTEDELELLVQSYGACGLGAALPRCAVGIDVAAYGHRHGAESLADLLAVHGELPATYRVTSRLGPQYDGVSGIRLFLMSDRWVSRATEAGWSGGWKDIDIVRYGHRHLVAPPTFDTRIGSAYSVLNEATGQVLDTLPRVDSLPLLPVAWCGAVLRPSAPFGDSFGGAL